MFQEQTFTEFLENFDKPKHTKIIQAYIQSFGGYIQKIEGALLDHDSDAIKAIAHDVKSIGYMTGAQDMGHTAETIETLIITGQKDQALEKTPHLLATMKQFLDIIQIFSKIPS